VRLRGWHAEGFGILADYTVSDLPTGLTLVHGANEAGKSTLLAFLRGVLFGYPSGRAELAYLPLRGGRHGGSLWVEAADGVYRVERFVGRRSPIAIVRPDGSEGTDTDLVALLGGADRQLFTSVFAFSLQQLASMEALSSDQIRARIFSAGIAGAGRSAREIIERLVKEDAELLGPRSGRIRELAHEAEGLQTNITRAQHRAADHRHALGREQDKEREVAGLHERLRQAETLARRFGTLVDLWDIESQRQQKAEALAQLPEIESFPPDPDTRLTTALDRLDGAMHGANGEEAHLAELTDRRVSLRTDDRLAGVMSTAERLAGECAMQLDRLERVVRTQGDSTAAQHAVEEVLQRLGAAWTGERVTRFDTSLPATEEVRAWQQRLHQTDEAARNALDDLASRSCQLAAVQDALRRLADAVSEGRAKPTDELVRSIGGRLARVAEAIGQADGRPVDVVADPKPLERAAATLNAAERHRDGIDLALSKARQDLRSAAQATGLHMLRDRAVEVARHVEVERQRLRDIAELEEDQRACENALERSIRDLGEGWNEPDVRGIATDFGQLRQIRDVADTLDDARTRVEAAARELDHVGKGRSAREKVLERFRLQLEAPEPTAKADLELQARALRRLRLRLGERAAVESERKAEERSKADARAEDSGAVRNPASSTWTPIVAASFAALLIAAGVWRVLVHDTIFGAVLLVAGLTGIALTLVLRSAARNVVARHDDRTRRERRVRELDERIKTLQGRADQLRDQAAAEARVLGLPEEVALEEVEDRQERWAADSEARRMRDDVVRQVRELEVEVESWRRSEEGRREEHQEAQRLAVTVAGGWQAWLSEHRLPAGIMPDAARDLLDQIRSLQARMVERDGLAQRLAAERKAWQAWRSEAWRVFQAAGERWTLPADDRELVDRLVQLQRDCGEDCQRAERRTGLEREIADWEAKLAVADEALVRAGHQAADVLAVAVGSVEEDWRRGEPEREAAAERLQSIAAESGRAKQLWDDWRGAHGLDASLSPEGVIDFFGLVTEARRAISRRDTARNHAAALRSEIDGWELQVRELLVETGLGCPGDEPHAWVEAARDLSNCCRADAALRQEATRLDQEIETTTSKCRRLRTIVEERAKELAALLGEAGVSNEEEFRSRLAVYRRREDLKREIGGLEARILAALGRGDSAEAARRELGTGRIEEWTSERDRHATDVHGLGGQHETAIREHENLVVARRQIEEACDVADLELQLQAVRAELEAAVHRRRVVRLSARLLRDTLGEYERLRQPQVLAKAGRSFANVTAGRYPHIVQTEDEDGIAVLDSAGRRHGLSDLSRGTQEQLYLCMRLGLAREFGDRAVALPLVMDDVLVNFDEARARRMAAELLEFARDNQVLLFTCHEFVRSLLLDLDPTVRVIDMRVHDIPVGGPTREHRPVRTDQDDSDLEGSARGGAEVSEQALLEALAPGAALSAAELADRLACSIDDLRPLLASLRASDRVTMIGQKRGARYALATQAGV
jgi:uncharacterized protein YhaN